jgi:hypothetical protein
MSTGMVTAVAGLIGAISALVVSVFSLQKTRAETGKLKAEADQIRQDTADIGSKAANAESMARLAYQTSSARKEELCTIAVAVASGDLTLSQLPGMVQQGSSLSHLMAEMTTFLLFSDLTRMERLLLGSISMVTLTARL